MGYGQYPYLKMDIDGWMEITWNTNKIQLYMQSTWEGKRVRAPDPWKSTGALVKFYLRAQWIPQNGRICKVFLKRDRPKFALDPWIFTWWGTLDKKVYREPWYVKRIQPVNFKKTHLCIFPRESRNASDRGSIQWWRITTVLETLTWKWSTLWNSHSSRSSLNSLAKSSNSFSWGTENDEKIVIINMIG